MKKKEIIPGGVYLAKVSNRIVKVRVDTVSDNGGRTIYGVTSLLTHRKLTFRSAQRFRSIAPHDGDGPEGLKTLFRFG